MIRKFTSAIIFSLFFCLANVAGQNLNVLDYENIIQANPDDNDISLYVDIRNDGQKEVELLWKRTITNMPVEMLAWICDNNLCYLPTADKASENKPNILMPGDTLHFEIHFKPNGMSANFEHKLEVFSKDDQSTTIVSIDHSIEVGTSVSTSSISKEAIKVFPNPTTNFFQINYPDVSQVTLFNIVGSQMAQFEAAPNRNYDVSGLKNGIYLVRMTDDQNNVIKTVRLSKR